MKWIQIRRSGVYFETVNWRKVRVEKGEVFEVVDMSGAGLPSGGFIVRDGDYNNLVVYLQDKGDWWDEVDVDFL